MRVWTEKGKGCFLRDNEGRIWPARHHPAKVLLNGEEPPPFFEADDREGWVLCAVGEYRNIGKDGARPRYFRFIPDDSDPHGVRTEIRRGNVEIQPRNACPSDGN